MKNTPCMRFALQCAVLVATLLPAASAIAETIRIIVGGIEKQIYLPAALAENMGYFKEQGLDVLLSSDTSGVNAEDELLSGAAQGVVGFYDHTIALQAKGKYVQCVVQFSRSPGEAQVVATRLADDIRSPRDFKGRTLGVTGLGSSTDTLTRYLTAINGVKGNEVRLLAAGSGATFLNAIRTQRIDVGMTTEPTVSQLLMSGDARLLVDLRTPSSTEKVMGGAYPGACLYMKTHWIGNHKPQVQRLVNALVKALRYVDAHAADDIAAHVPPSYYLGNEAIYVAALRDSKSMFVADGTMPVDGPETVLKVLKTVDRTVRSKPIDLSRTYTREFAAAAR